MPREQWSWDREEAFFRDRKHERSEPLGFPHHGGPRDFYRWGPPDFRRPPGDRKELFFKDRRYERFDPIGPPPPPVRWRDSYHHNNYARNFHRWGGSPDFRRPPGGFGKQGGWHMVTEESGNSYGPSRSSERSMEGDGFRPYVYRGNGRYSGRNGRDNRSSFSQRDWRGGSSWETTNDSPSAPGRLHVIGGDRRSADNIPTHSSHLDSCLERSGKSNQVHSKDQQDKSGGINDLSMSHNFDRENQENSPVSTDWKPLKWSRSGSLSSRALGFSHASCTKGISGDDSNEARVDLQEKNTNPIQSPSGDAPACLTSAVPVEETASQRKQRLGWGEGLAKYEKKKVEGTDESEKNGSVIASTSLEPFHSACSNLGEKSPRIAGSSDCASPATPSFACSSSSGLDEKSFVKPSNPDNDIINSCGSLGPVSLNLEGFSFELERSDSTVNNLGSTLIELLQTDQTVSVDSSFVRSTAMNKVLVLKGNVLKDLEITESRVDSLENELKSIISDSMVNDYCLPVLADDTKSNKEHAAADAIPRSASLQIVSSRDVSVDEIPLPNAPWQGMRSDRKEDVDSPGTATSKFSEHLYIENAVFSSGIAKGRSCSVSEISPNDVETKRLASASSGGGPSAYTDGGGMHPDTDNGGSAPDDSSKEDDLYKFILASNKKVAHWASEELFSFSPKDLCKSYMLEPDDLSCLQSVSAIGEKFVVKKRFQRFKERLLTIKFQILQHLWKHDLDLPPLKKSHAKSQKKIELGLRTAQSGCQKRRSSIRSQATSSLARSLALVPPSEVIDFTRKLLLDSQPKMCRTSLKMPVLISDKEERKYSRFLSSNGLIEDPFAVERERALINIWTAEEKENFMDKLAIFGKNFRKIASFLEHKTTADCVEFYYKNHKSECFAKTKKHDLRKQSKSSANAYLLTSQRKWNREMNNAASLDMLGTVSMIASGADDIAFKQPFRARLFFGGCSESKAPQADDSTLEQQTSYGNFGNERESVAADVLACMSGSLSSEAMSSCVTSSVDLPKNRDLIYQKLVTRKRPWTPNVAENVDETGSDESCEDMICEHWTDREKSAFIQAITSYGKDFSAISRLVKTKSRKQCKVYFSKARKCLGLDSLCGGHGVVRPSASDDADDSGSDVDDGCAVETGSVVYHDNMGFKLETEIVTTPMDAKHFGPGPVKKIKVEPHVELIINNKTDWAGHRDGEDVETLVTNACQSKEKTNIKILYDSPKKSKALCSEENVASFVDSGVGKDQQFNQGRLVAESSYYETTDPAVSSSDSVNVETVVTETGRERAVNDVDVSGSLILGNHMTGSLDDFSNMDAGSSCLHGPDKEPSTIKHSLETRFRQGHQQLQAIPEISTMEQPAASLQYESSFSTGNSLPHYSGMDFGERMNIPDRSSSTLDYHESKDEEQHNVSGEGNKLDCSEQSSCHHHAESSNILQGQQLQSSTESKVNGDFNGGRAEVHSLVKSKRINNQTSAQDCYLKRCGNSKSHSLTSDHAQYPEQKSFKSPPAVRSSSDSDKPPRACDVRLFGKIIRHTSSQEQPTTKVQKSDERKINRQPIRGKQSKLKSICEENADGNSAIPKCDQSNYMDPENLPTTNYGYWSRLQSSLSTMPDSAMLLSKYPAAFCNFTTLPSQKQPQSVGSSNCIFNGSFSKEMSDKGAVDFQIYKGQDGSKVQKIYKGQDGIKVQPFTVDMTQCEDIYSKMQRYSGLDAMSALQPRERGAVGIDVLGRVGACHTVQDPVTAIRMEYAKVAQNGEQGGGIIREEDTSWRGKGV